MFIACIPAHAAYFSIYEWSKVTFGVDQPGHHPMAAAMSGALATAVHDAIMTPMDVVKQRLQLGYYGGLLDCINTISRTEGLMVSFLFFIHRSGHYVYALIILPQNRTTWLISHKTNSHRNLLHPLQSKGALSVLPDDASDESTVRHGYGGIK